MAYPSALSDCSSDLIPSIIDRMTDDVAPYIIFVPFSSSQCTPEKCCRVRNKNDRLNAFLAPPRPVLPERMYSMSLVCALTVVDALVDVGWRRSVAQRTVAFLVIGQQ